MPSAPGQEPPKYGEMSEEEKLKHKPNEESMRKKYGDRPTEEDRKKIDEFKPDITKFTELPAKYMDPGKSDLRFTVKAGDANEFAVDLQD
jgi:hypothetical protein